MESTHRAGRLRRLRACDGRRLGEGRQGGEPVSGVGDDGASRYGSPHSVNSEGEGTAAPLDCSQCSAPIGGVAYFVEQRRRQPVCRACLVAQQRQRWAAHRQFMLDHGVNPGPFAPDLPLAHSCDACGRPIAFFYWHGLFVHVCSPTCQRARRNLRRRVTHEQTSCSTCGKTFTPTRRDARFCSGACRQKAYRQREKTT